jgi:hypothetical protein
MSLRPLFVLAGAFFFFATQLCLYKLHLPGKKTRIPRGVCQQTETGSSRVGFFNALEKRIENTERPA